MTELTQEQITEQTNEFFNYLASRFSLESIQLFTEEQMERIKRWANGDRVDEWESRRVGRINDLKGLK